MEGGLLLSMQAFNFGPMPCLTVCNKQADSAEASAGMHQLGAQKSFAKGSFMTTALTSVYGSTGASHLSHFMWILLL